MINFIDTGLKLLKKDLYWKYRFLNLGEMPIKKGFLKDKY